MNRSLILAEVDRVALAVWERSKEVREEAAKLVDGLSIIGTVKSKALEQGEDIPDDVARVMLAKVEAIADGALGTRALVEATGGGR